MSSYLVEAYAPAGRSIAEVADDARRAAGESTSSGTEVRYVRSILVRTDETGFHLFEAASADAVWRVAERAGLQAPRVVESQVIEEG